MRADIEELRRTFEAFKSTPFPSCAHVPLGSVSYEELDDAHAALMMYDAYIAGSLWCVTYGQAPSDPLKADHTLRTDLEKLVSEDSPSITTCAKVYLEYVDQIERLIGMANHFLGKFPSRS